MAGTEGQSEIVGSRPQLAYTGAENTGDEVKDSKKTVAQAGGCPRNAARSGTEKRRKEFRSPVTAVIIAPTCGYFV